MASRTIAVSILADTKELQQNLNKAEGSLSDFGTKAESEAKEAKAHLESVGDAGDTTATRMSILAGAMGDVGGVVADKLGMPGLANAMQNAGTYMMGLAGIGDIVAVTMETVKESTLFAKVATIGKTIAEKAAAVASKAFAAAQWLLNAALSANPIGLVVIAIAGLVAALVIAYKKSETFRNIVNKAFGAVMNVVKNVLPTIKKIVTVTWNAIKTATSTVWNGIKTAVTAVIKAVGTVVKTYFNTYKTIITTVWNTVKSVTTGAFKGIKSIVTDAFGDVVSFIRDVPSKITALGSRFFNAGASIMHRIVDGIKGAAGFIGSVASGIWDAVKSMINQAISHINSALEFTIHLPLGKSFTINPPDIPFLANGGIVSSPTLAVIGEAGPEAVVPLNGKYGNTTVNINVNVAPTSDKAAIGREIGAALDAYYKQGGRRLAIG